MAQSIPRRLPRPARRNDARRNREAILRVAGQAFAEEPAPPPLEEIARRTGLGRATVYRHFPDRRALAAAVAAEQLDRLERAAAAPPELRCSFRDLLDGVLTAQVSRRPLASLMKELPEREQTRLADALIALVTPAMRQAQAAGEVRADLEPEDLALVLRMTEAAADARPPGPGHDAAVRRLLDTLLDGFAARPPEHRRAVGQLLGGSERA